VHSHAIHNVNFKGATMKRRISRTAAAASIFSVLAFLPLGAIAEHKCDNPLSTIDQRACAKAAEGPAALRSFVSRTKTIWGLYYWDYARRDDQGTTASAPMQPAPAVDAALKTATATTVSR